MTKNLEMADAIVKLILSASVIVFYSVGIISGMPALLLLLPAILVILIFAFKVLFVLITKD